jgi:hypothetical protein
MATTPPPPPPEPQEQRKKTLLELFSGSAQMSRAFREHGWNSITLDSDPRCGADLQMSVLDFEPSVHLPPGTKIDLVWASPICTFYSTLRGAWGKPTDAQLQYADSLVQKTVQIARELDAPILLENPWTGALKSRGLPELESLDVRLVDYCRYSFPHRKRTAIWTNTSWQPARPLCQYDCPSSTVDPVTRRKKHVDDWKTRPHKERAVIPQALCDEIAAHFSTPPPPPPAVVL